MSWDKNTIIISKVPAVKETLEHLGVPYKISTIGSFKGRGLNDDTYMENLDILYELLRLEYKDRVILEYAELDADCDTDDIVASQEFDLKDEPKDWIAVRYTDKIGDYPGWNGKP